MNRKQKKLIDATESVFLECFSEYYKKFKFAFDCEETDEESVLKVIASIEMDNNYKSDVELFVETDIDISDTDELRCYIAVVLFDDRVCFSEENIWKAVAINKCVS